MSFPGQDNPFVVIEERQAEAIGYRLFRDVHGQPWSWAMVAERMGIKRPTAFQLAAKGWRRLKLHGFDRPGLREQLFPKRPESADDLPRRRRAIPSPT